jgi:hypothetical protein
MVRTLFWTDLWLQGKSISELAPSLFDGVPKRRRKSRTVREALNNNVWVSDFSGALSVGVLLEYLQLWDTLQDINMQSDTEDTHVWCFTANGQYSAKTAYEAMFVGATEFSPWERIWKTWAPPKCRFFMWLVARKRCWTADRLA